jgi:hypothetical protein
MSNFINKQLKRKKMRTNEVMRLGAFCHKITATEVVLFGKLGRNEVFA